MLEILDKSDYRHPSLIATYDFKRGSEFQYKYSKLSIALTPDGNTLYLASLGLHVFDVTNRDKPKLENSHYDDLLTAVRLTSDVKFMYVGQKDLAIFDLSDPRTPKPVHKIQTEGNIKDIEMSKDNKKLYIVMECLKSRSYTQINGYSIGNKTHPNEIKDLKIIYEVSVGDVQLRLTSDEDQCS